MMLVARTRVGRWLRAVTAVVLLAALACTGGADDPEPGAIGSSETPAGDAGAVTVTQAEQRIGLERRLGHHTMLVIDAMRATADGGGRRDDSRRLAEVRRALRRNTDQVIVSLHDVIDVDAVDAAWVPRIEALLDIAGGGDGDEELGAAQAEYGAVVADAVEGISAEDAAAQLAELDAHLRRQIAAYRDDDLPESYAAQREAFSTAFRLGQQLVVAAGAAPEVTAGATELRSALQQLLAEHTWLTLTTARRNVRGGRAAEPPAAALNGNTEDLTAALLSIYDEDAAVGFDERWRDAIAALMQFTAAATELDDDARRSAARDLRRATRDLAEQLTTMTDSAISQRQGRQALTRHFRLLRRHSNAMADNRVRRAYDLADAAYAGSGALADLIAAGIVEDRPDEFPQQ